MDVLKRNLVANLAGTLWFGGVTVALVPVYVRLLGIEAFGLIAFQTTLAGIIALCDLGLSLATNRELARLSVSPAGAAESRSVTRTTEIVYWSIGAAVGAILLALSPVIASRWLNIQHLPLDVAAQAVAWAIVAAILYFPYAFYAAGLFGLQRHVAANAILIAGTTLRAGGSLIVLLVVVRDVRALFAWQAFASLVQTLAAAIVLYRALPAGPGRFAMPLLRRMFTFARGVALSGTLGLIATQVDKLAVSKLLPLAVFGYYSIAGMIAAAIALAVTPVQTTVFPRFSQLVAIGDGAGLRRAYHGATQTLAAMLMPMSAVAIVFAYEILLVWTGDATVARAAHWVAMLLIAGAAMNALSHISHAVQLAHGWTTPAVLANAVQLVVMIPLTLFVVRRYGAVGAAAVWAVLQLSFLTISLTLTHGRLLRGEIAAWFLRDAGPPLVASFAVAALGRFVVGPGSPMQIVSSVAVVAVAVVLAGVLSAAEVRGRLGVWWKTRAVQPPRR
jgi:O-antigen/teichoic acid export membrane protein